MTHRVDLSWELLKSTWHHICPVEVRIRRNIHQLLAGASLLRLHRTRVVVVASETAVGSHRGIGNGSEARCGISIANTSAEAGRRLVLVVASHWRHSGLNELHILEVKIRLLLVESRLNVGADEWNILDDIASTIAAVCCSNARAGGVGCCSSATRRLTLCRRRWLRAGETQRWRVNTTRSYCGIRTHRRWTAHSIVGTKR